MVGPESVPPGRCVALPYGLREDQRVALDRFDAGTLVVGKRVDDDLLELLDAEDAAPTRRPCGTC